jgi:hypothetical protein
MTWTRCSETASPGPRTGPLQTWRTCFGCTCARATTGSSSHTVVLSVAVGQHSMKWLRANTHQHAAINSRCCGQVEWGCLPALAAPLSTRDDDLGRVGARGAQPRPQGIDTCRHRVQWSSVYTAATPRQRCPGAAHRAQTGRSTEDACTGQGRPHTSSRAASSVQPPTPRANMCRHGVWPWCGPRASACRTAQAASREHPHAHNCCARNPQGARRLRRLPAAAGRPAASAASPLVPRPCPHSPVALAQAMQA